MDKNFTRQKTVAKEEADWYDARELTLYGLIPEQELLGRRLPKEIAESVNKGVFNYSAYCAGGRLRFSTDSSFLALEAQYGPGAVPTVNNHCVSYGLDLYRCDGETEEFQAAVRPVDGFDYKTGSYKMTTNSQGKLTPYTLNLPVFSSLSDLQIGIEKGCTITVGKPYRNEKPVVFYGSSITHGAAAGRPGNTYESFISQTYNLDYVNLGFSGNAKGEQTMARYIADLPMSVFVCDYDYNAPTLEHLKNTHYAFYETIRQKQPDVPYIMISRPNFFCAPEPNSKRRQVILESFEKAKALGDKRVYFIDGETLFEGEFARSCTSDGTHPNDLGFFRMAQKIGPVVEKAYELFDGGLKIG
ncbi:MAG: hypothetical protein IKD31_04360 [Clostridia bacterium]|nr:hypothetical protein [Clostridia bacterium]